MGARSLATRLTTDHIAVGDDGMIRAPDAPGLGLEVDPSAVSDMLLDVEITVDGANSYRTPAFGVTPAPGRGSITVRTEASGQAQNRRSRSGFGAESYPRHRLP